MDNTIPCLLCDQCQMPLCSLSDIMADRAPVMDAAVYSYELDLLGEDVWVYSATNPTARRFDVVRCSSSVVAQHSVKCEQRFSKEHSWFPPYAWCMCECASCGRHLGWGFSTAASTEEDEGASPHEVAPLNAKRQRVEAANASTGGSNGVEEEAVHRSSSAPTSTTDSQATGDDDDVDSDADGATDGAYPSTSASSVGSAEDGIVAFVGIIVTHCKPVEDYPLDKYHALMDLAGDRQQKQRTFQRSLGRLFSLLPRIPNQLAANQLAMQLLQLPFDRRNEVVDQLLASAEAMLADATSGNDPGQAQHGRAPDEGGGATVLSVADNDGVISDSDAVSPNMMPPTDTLGYERTLSMDDGRGGAFRDDVAPS